MLGLDDLAVGVGEAVGGVWGLGLVAVAAVVVIPRAKPLAREAMRGYFAVTEGARTWAAEAGEQVQDLYAEAKHEYEAEREGSGEERRAPRRTRPARARG